MNWREHAAKRRDAYKAALLGPPGESVLQDLARFCHMDRSTFKISKDGRSDPLAMALAEGRREVYLYIRQQMTLTDTDIEHIAREDE